MLTDATFWVVDNHLTQVIDLIFVLVWSSRPWGCVSKFNENLQIYIGPTVSRSKRR